MAEKVARALNHLGANRDLLESADAEALLELIDEYLEDSEGIAPPATQPFNYRVSTMNNSNDVSKHCYVLLYIYVDLDTSTVAPSSDPSEDDEQLSLDPPVDDPPAEDDEDAEEEPVEEPTAAEIVKAGVSRGQLDDDTIPVDQRAVDNFRRVRAKLVH